MSKKIRLGLFGLGTVGSGLINIIEKRKAQLLESDGIELEVVKAVVRDTNKTRGCTTEDIEITSNLDDILKDDSLDLIVELIGGTDVASTIVKTALNNQKPVVSANKALIAEQGEELLKLANEAQVPFFAEASVGGGIPILKTLRESLVANEIKSLTAIINGTTNFILTKMEEEGLSYKDALQIASELGFAEADPTFDVEGIDAQQKLRILAAHILGGNYPVGEISCEGITALNAHDFAFAEKHDLSIKLLALAIRKNGEIELRVHPTLISNLHPLASVRNEFNAVFLNGDAVGEVMLSGRGAGSLPTASAVYADIVDICTRTSTSSTPKQKTYNTVSIVKKENIETEYYLCFTILDQPGVIGEIASILGKNKISVSSVSAELIENSDDLGVVDVIVHKSKESSLIEAIKEVNQLERTRGEGKFIRIERNI